MNNGELNSNENTGAVDVRKKMLAAIYDYVEIVSVAIVAVLIIFSFIAQLSTVNGTSMAPTLAPGDRLVISNLFYKPKTGDIVVFQQGDGYFSEPLIKRVIATEGQTVKIDFDKWLVYVDGKPLNETYVLYEPGRSMDVEDYYYTYRNYLDETMTMTVPKGYVFVLGDNRNGSSDSRFSGVGFVNENEIMGRVLVRMLPFQTFGKVK